MANLDKVFYYDRELSNRATSVRIYDPDGGNKLICRAILQSGYGYSVTNKWGGNSSIVDTLINTVGGMITSTTGKLASEAAKSFGDAFGIQAISDIGRTAGKYANSHIFSIAETIKSFEGTDFKPTGVDSIKIKLVSDKKGNSVLDQVAKLNKYAIGPSLTTGSETLNEWVGIQAPPNNYTWEISNTTKTGRIPKTLTMFVGNFMVINNLLVESLNVEFSPQTVMEEEGKNIYDGNESDKFIVGKPSNIPLYADVELSFTYARMITNEDIPNFFVATGGEKEVEEDIS